MSVKEKFSERWKSLERSLQFWVRAVDIYVGYKVCQLRTSFVRDSSEQEDMWERQHALAAEKMYLLCSELSGFFLKAAQIFGKPDLAPAAWVRRLVTLCDRAPETPFKVVQQVVEEELGKNFDEVFERFHVEPVGSASIAQVHRARLKNAKTDVAVKVQHPGGELLMMIDIHNLQAFAKFLQKEINFDLFSLTKEVEKQIRYEFDFRREAEAMERIRNFFRTNNRAAPVLVPRIINGMVTRKVLVMEFIHGIPIMNLGDVIAQRGIDPCGKLATAAKQKILENLTLAYGQMILKSGFFHADPHPGNILICKDSKVALLDYGQVKQLPDYLRLGFANLVVAIADKNPSKAAQSYRELGIETSNSDDDEEELFQLAMKMFDTKLPGGITTLSPFSEESSLKKISVQSFTEELFSVLRTMQLLRGLSVGMGISYSCAEQWRPLAEEALYRAGRLKDDGRIGTFAIGNEKFPASLLDLPGVVESYKTYDDTVLIKTVDIGQIIMVREEGEPSPEGIEYRHGLNHPMRDARRRRFRREPDLNPELVQRVEKDLLNIMSGWTDKNILLYAGFHHIFKIAVAI